MSVAVAKHFDTCILSADSRQFYKELAIGTAKPDSEEQDGVKHYFIDSHSIDDEVTSAQFESAALDILEEEFKKHDFVVLTGGSGMFVDALCIGLDNIPTSPQVKEQVQQEFEAHGLEPLIEELRQKDPGFHAEADLDNPMRVMRAIEVIRITGEKFSELRKRKPAPRPFKVHRFVIDHDREVLYDRINRRVDIMLDLGLVEEARSVFAKRHLKSLNTVGYKELFEHFEGKIGLEEAIEKIKQNTRRYAKRQLTWFRRHPDSHWVKFDSNEKMLKEILIQLKKIQEDS